MPLEKRFTPYHGWWSRLENGESDRRARMRLTPLLVGILAAGALAIIWMGYFLLLAWAATALVLLFACWLMRRGYPVLIDGGITRVAGGTCDITEAKANAEALERARAERQTMLDATSIGLAVFRQGNIVRCNRALEEMLGYAPGELQGRPVASLYPSYEYWRKLKADLVESRKGGEPYSGEFELMRRDGTRLAVLLNGRRVNLEEQHSVVSYVDISAQRALANALEEAKLAAETANRAKSSFLASMSHEIRTPMNGILGMLELLEIEETDNSRREQFGIINESAKTLLALIDDILDLSKIESGQLSFRPEPVSIPTLVNQVALPYRNLAKRKNIPLDIVGVACVAPYHLCDGLRLRQILNNLLSNALKFTESGRIAIAIESRWRDTRVEEVRIVVSDTGIGISAADQQRLFAPFVQVDTGSTKRYGGTGLGLSISRRLVEAMGGEINLTSTLGLGSTFTVTLPLPLGQNSGTAPKPPARLRLVSAGQRPLVLLAEDEPINRTIISRQLKTLGYDVDIAEDGQMALELWRQKRYDAVLADCFMPRMDGYTLAREIRAIERALAEVHPVPIIACTANALQGESERCLAAGMNDYAAKPLALNALGDLLRKWVGVEVQRGEGASSRAKIAV
ncbi:MAG: ATP-binding protein [Burkholderiales bacterium]